MKGLFSKHIKLSGIILCLIVLITACSKKEALPLEIKSKQPLQQIIDNGTLLNSVDKQGDIYVFRFETESLNVPAGEIKEVLPNREQWKTLIVFNDNSQITIPSKGDNLSFIVENIELNPSGYNPLAAKVQVNLPTYGRVKVTVQGKNGVAGNIVHLCQAQTPRQVVPILGLYPDYNNKVILTFTDKEGNERGSTEINIKTGELPVLDFPKIKVVKSDFEKMEPGVNLVSYPGMSELDTSIPYMVDAEGNVRWILLLKSSPDLKTFSGQIGLQRTKKGTFISGDQSVHRIVEIDMFGNLLKQWDLFKMGYTFHHEVKEAKNGNFLVTVSKSSARLSDGKPRVNDIIIELDPVNSAVVKEWDLSNMLDTARYLRPDANTPQKPFTQSPTNWAHNNSINELGNNYLATVRFQGVMSFTGNGTLRWIISPHKNWGAKYQPYLLRPIDEMGTPVTNPSVINGDTPDPNFDWPWGPHTPIVLPNNHILVFDNGYNRNWSYSIVNNNNYSRVVEYKVDENNKTVQQVWSYGKERGAEAFAPALSGVQYLSHTKNIMFCPGLGVKNSTGLGGKIIEINPVNKEVVFEMEISVPSISAFHRATRLNLYPENL